MKVNELEKVLKAVVLAHAAESTTEEQKENSKILCVASRNLIQLKKYRVQATDLGLRTGIWMDDILNDEVAQIPQKKRVRLIKKGEMK